MSAKLQFSRILGRMRRTSANVRKIDPELADDLVHLHEQLIDWRNDHIAKLIELGVDVNVLERAFCLAPNYVKKLNRDVVKEKTPVSIFDINLRGRRR